MMHLSAFADEIAADPQEQMRVLVDQGIHALDLRSAWGTNVLDLTDAQVAALQGMLATQNISVAAIGSPIGKVALTAPFAAHLRRFERALELAHIFQTPFIRIFSFYLPSGSQGEATRWRAEVLARLRELTARARAAGLILLHENERGIYADTLERCLDVLESINDPHLRQALDPANFLLCGQTPYPTAYQALRPWLSSLHVKDACADGRVVVAGEGLACWPALLAQLQADGYDGVLTLEPHLAEAGQFQGFSGPALFQHASQTLQGLLQELHWEHG
ncbi:MAG TPA: sugar phosphate isomerase/epimerase [Ktedonobacteraceae bacterium]|jgi:sugar phosphate isomerase/epimerase